MGLEPTTWILLSAGAATAGWVDAVIGGGGLVLIPLLLAGVPQLPSVSALAINKVTGICGTTSAAIHLVRRSPLHFQQFFRYIPIALVCSGAGALVASALSKEVMRPIIIVLMVIVGVFVALRPEFGMGDAHPMPVMRSRRGVAAMLGAGVFAFYDGIFGPGTGMFLITMFSSVLAQDFLTSAVLTKVVNVATNAGALTLFIIGGHVWWELAVILALANIAGAQLGARTVLSGGKRFLRYALLSMVIAMALYLGYQQYASGS